MAVPVKISLNPPNTLQSVLNRNEAKAHGPFTVGSNLYLVLTDDDPGGTQDFRLQVWKSTDSGATWTEKSPGSGPIVFGNYFATLNGTTIELVYISLPPAPLRRITYQEFDTVLDAYGVADSSGSDLLGSGQLQATKLISGDYLCFYIGNFDYLSIRRTGGLWQPPTIEFAKLGASNRDHGLTSDSASTGFYVYSQVVSGTATLYFRSLTLGGILSAASTIAIGSSGFGSDFNIGPLSFWQNGLVIPTPYDELGFPQAPVGSPGFWFGTPVSSPIWTFRYTTGRAHLLVFLPIDFSNGVLFWSTTGPTVPDANKLWTVAYDGANFGTPSVFWNWNTDPPAGGGVVPAADQLLLQPSIAAVTGGYGMAIAMAYNFPAEDYSTFYLSAGTTPPPPTNVQLNRFEMT